MGNVRQYTRELVRVGELNITVYSAGNHGSPVFLLHGGGTDSALLSWRYAMLALAEEHRVYALDWPGYGDSDPMDEPYALERLVPILAGVMDTYEVDRAHLVGLSMGGGAAIAFTLTHPQRVGRLVLVDSYGIQRKAPYHLASYLYIQMPFLVKATWAAMRRNKNLARTALKGIFADPKGMTEELVDELMEAVQNRSGERAFYAFQRYEIQRKGLRSNFVDRMPAITQPTLFIHGDVDVLVPIEEVRQVAGRMPDARMAVMENTSHWPPREHPEAFHRLVLDFLNDTQ